MTPQTVGLDVMTLMTIKGPGVQGRQTSVKVNRTVNLIVMLDFPNLYIGKFCFCP